MESYIISGDLVPEWRCIAAAGNARRGGGMPILGSGGPGIEYGTCLGQCFLLKAEDVQIYISFL